MAVLHAAFNINTAFGRIRNVIVPGAALRSVKFYAFMFWWNLSSIFEFLLHPHQQMSQRNKWNQKTGPLAKGANVAIRTVQEVISKSNQTHRLRWYSKFQRSQGTMHTSVFDPFIVMCLANTKGPTSEFVSMLAVASFLQINMLYTGLLPKGERREYVHTMSRAEPGILSARSRSFRHSWKHISGRWAFNPSCPVRSSFKFAYHRFIMKRFANI